MLNPSQADRYILTSRVHTKSVTTSGMSIVTKNGDLRVGFLVRDTLESWATGITVDPDQWFHLTLTWSKNNALTMYINGCQEPSMSSASYTPHSPSTSSAMVLGRPSSLNIKYGGVSMDEWFFWNYPLNHDKVKTIFELYQN